MIFFLRIIREHDQLLVVYKSQPRHWLLLPNHSNVTSILVQTHFLSIKEEGLFSHPPLTHPANCPHAKWPNYPSTLSLSLSLSLPPARSLSLSFFNFCIFFFSFFLLFFTIIFFLFLFIFFPLFFFLLFLFFLLFSFFLLFLLFLYG